MKNRSRIEIFYDITTAARGSARKTHLMYKANLSFKQLDLYLKFLIRRSLVEERYDLENGARIYFVTSKGLHFLSLFENLLTLMGNPKSYSKDGTGHYVAPSPEYSEPNTNDYAVPQVIH